MEKPGNPKELPGVIGPIRTLDGSLDGSLLRRRDGEGRGDGLEGSEASQHVDRALIGPARAAPFCLLRTEIGQTG